MRKLTILTFISLFFQVSGQQCIDEKLAEKFKEKKIKSQTMYEYRLINKDRPDSYIKRDKYSRIIEQGYYKPDSKTVLSKKLYTYNSFNLISSCIIYDSLNKIDSKTIYYYDIRNNPLKTISINKSGTKEVFNMHTYTYDSVGHILGDSLSNTDPEGVCTKKYKYDEKGNCIFYKVDGRYPEVTLKSYDQQNRIIELNTTISLSERSVITYVYDSIGQILNEKSFICKGKVDGIAACSVKNIFFSYDNKGNLTEQVQYDKNDKIIEKQIYKYNDNGKLLENSMFNIYNDVREITNYTYNKEGILLESILQRFRCYPGTSEKLIVYQHSTCDTKGNVILIITKNDVTDSYKNVFEYDKSGNLKSSLSFDSKGILTFKTLFVTVYDE